MGLGGSRTLKERGELKRIYIYKQTKTLYFIILYQAFPSLGSRAVGERERGSCARCAKNKQMYHKDVTKKKSPAQGKKKRQQKTKDIRTHTSCGHTCGADFKILLVLLRIVCEPTHTRQKKKNLKYIHSYVQKTHPLTKKKEF
eukprot:GEMP01050039.1.p1 GENE.GEMP01050039.1~~GEMP01050039.1.p1  ORF type:complete len:143 (-),score=5.01 GEMP01050039.1:377-805(-)